MTARPPLDASLRALLDVARHVAGHDTAAAHTIRTQVDRLRHDLERAAGDRIELARLRAVARDHATLTATTQVAQLAKTLRLPAVLAELDTTGWPATHDPAAGASGGQRTLPSDDDDPTGVPVTAVEAEALTPPDLVARHRRDLTADLRTLARILDRQATRHDYWTTPAAPKSGLDSGDPGCAMHRRLREHGQWGRTHSRAWAPVHRTGNVGGNLEVEMALCRWCYDWVRSTGGLPTYAELAAHVDGRRVKVRA